MQPRSYDDVFLAYAMAVRDRNRTQDALRDAAQEVARLQTELQECIKRAHALRADVEAFQRSEVAA